MRVPRSYSGPTQLLGMGMEGREVTRAAISLPPEPGVPGLFASAVPHLDAHYLDYAVYRRDREMLADRGENGVTLTFSDCWKAPDAAPDLAVFYLPKEKPLTAYVLAELGRELQPGTPVLLVGPKRGGIGSCRPLVERHLGQVLSSRSARHCVLLEARTEAGREPYAGARTFEVPVAGRTVQVVSHPGVFSHGEVDPGTRLLLDRLPAGSVTRALDWGCGSGVLGAALRLLHPEARVDLVDTNAMALRSARETLAANGLTADGVWASDGLSEVDDGYDLIVSNPPFHSGAETTYGATERFIRKAPERLHEHGRLLLVTNAFINYFPVLREAFPVVSVPVQTRRYRVIEARMA
jgi:16S rRNA (guanine1207-N2)-methyltransferase